MIIRCLFAVILIGAALAARRTEAQLAEYFVAIDSRTAAFSAPAGEGGGLYPDNPNFGRLTLLFNHGEHFHAIGSYRYVGSAAAPVLEDTSANNRLPEASSGERLALKPGVGPYAGKLTTRGQVGVEYSRLELRNVHQLSGVDDVLFDSSSNRWNASFDADVHLKLLGVSSPLLQVGSLADPNAVPVGGDVHLGEGSENFSFTPVLWIDATAPVGNYSAEFQLIDPNDGSVNSGRFFVDLVHVPEPGTAMLGGFGLLGLALLGRRS